MTPSLVLGPWDVLWGDEEVWEVALSHNGFLKEEQRQQNALYWPTIEKRRRDGCGFVGVVLLNRAWRIWGSGR